MKPERAAMLAGALVQSLAIWADELRLVQAVPGPEGEGRKRHLVCSIDQAKQSLKQMLERQAAAEGPE